MEWNNEERLVLYVVVGMRAVLDDIQRDTCVARAESLLVEPGKPQRFGLKCEPPYGRGTVAHFGQQRLHTQDHRVGRVLPHNGYEHCVMPPRIAVALLWLSQDPTWSACGAHSPRNPVVA